MSRARVPGVIAFAVVLVFVSAPTPTRGAGRPGIAPDGPWTCPSTHPIKGYLSASGRRVYFLPHTAFYDEASPERCYVTEDEARRDGADPAPPGGRHEVARVRVFRRR